MPVIKEQSYVIKRINSILVTIFNKLENNNNAEFSSNGEDTFLDSFLETLTQNTVIFDVGANIGEYSDIIINKFRKKGKEFTLHIFEPSTLAFRTLEAKFAGTKNIVLNNFGISDSERTAELFFDNEGSTLASLYPRQMPGEVNLDKKNFIMLRTLADYISEKSINRIDFLKIDIEGHELSALKGLGEFLSPSLIKVIQFEYGGANLDSKTSLLDLYKFLESAGYMVCKVMRHHLELRPYNPMMENFQYSNYIALSKEFKNG